MELLDELYQRSFLNACRAALNGGVRVEVLLLDPDCRAAAQRAEELGSSLDVRSLILENLRCFRRFRTDDLNENAKSRFKVRVYATSPLAAYYRWDRRALIAFFPTDRSSVDTKQYETSVDSNFAQFVERRFSESWAAPNTYTLQYYFTLPVKIMRDSAEPLSLFVDWVVLEDRIYLTHPVLTSYALKSGLDRLQVHLDPVVSYVKPFAGACRLAQCDTESSVHQSFDRKYGEGAQRTIFEVFRSAVDPPPNQHENRR